jgi:hypothetical protein
MGRLLPVVLAIAIAAAMGALGALITPFRPQELILPSIITWSVLLPAVRTLGLGLTVLVGAVSPFIGAVIAVLVNQGVAEARFHEARDLSGVVFYAIGYVLVTAKVSIPIGVVTALTVRWVTRRTRTFGPTTPRP